MKAVIGFHQAHADHETFWFLVRHISVSEFKLLAVVTLGESDQEVLALDHNDFDPVLELGLRAMFTQVLRDNPAVRDDIQAKLKEAANPS